MLEVKLFLKAFKDEMKTSKKHTNYIPVTMDELMVRFVLNLHRNEFQDTFTDKRRLLDKSDLRKEDEDDIRDKVTESMTALQNLMM